MLMNIAEDLKEYAKIKVSPIEEGASAIPQSAPKVTKGVSSKGQVDSDESPLDGEAYRRKRDSWAEDEEEDGDDMSNSKDYVKMEL